MYWDYVDFIKSMPTSSLMFICFILHVVADFKLQGMLGNVKQKKWWTENHPEEIYKEDYKAAGWIHALFWAAFTFLPYCWSDFYCFVIWGNGIIHYFIDDMKANKSCISLTTDQMLHVLQIVATCMIMSFVIK